MSAKGRRWLCHLNCGTERKYAPDCATLGIVRGPKPVAALISYAEYQRLRQETAPDNIADHPRRAHCGKAQEHGPEQTAMNALIACPFREP